MMRIIRKKNFDALATPDTNTFLQIFMHNKNEYTKALIVVNESSSVS